MAGENPIYVKTGDIIIPPPTPISEPIIPDPNPIITRIRISSIKLFFLYIHFRHVDKLKFILFSWDTRERIVDLSANKIQPKFKK
jgi:hypothetical protein